MAYNQADDLILGEGLMLYIKTGSTGSEKLEPIAYATSHELAINGETIDTSSKMSGAWKDSLVGQLGWQVTSESLISKTTGHMSFNTLFALMTARNPIDIVIGTAKGEEDDFELDSSKPQLVGQAMITSLTKTATKGEVCSSSLTLEGKGKLESE